MTEHVVVAATLRKDETVLLCHRSPERRWYPNVWDFPGGHVEGSERPEAALRREILEELGVDIGLVTSLPILELFDDSRGFHLRVWDVTSWQGTVTNRQLDEHDAIGWFRRADLGDLSFADAAYVHLLTQLLPERA